MSRPAIARGLAAHSRVGLALRAALNRDAAPGYVRTPCRHLLPLHCFLFIASHARGSNVLARPASRDSFLPTSRDRQGAVFILLPLRLACAPGYVGTPCRHLLPLHCLTCSRVQRPRPSSVTRLDPLNEPRPSGSGLHSSSPASRLCSGARRHSVTTSSRPSASRPSPPAPLRAAGASTDRRLKARPAPPFTRRVAARPPARGSAPRCGCWSGPTTAARP